MRESVEDKMEEHHRRFDDKLTECKKAVDTKLDTYAETMLKMQADIQSMKEILEAWNSMKGFATGMRFISTTIKIITSIIVFLGTIYILIKTGQLPKG